MAQQHEKCDSVQTLYFLLEKAVKFPSQQHCAVDEIIAILRTTKFDANGLKTALEFYKCLFPIAIVPLERNLFACGVLSEEDITKPALPSFLAQVLFEVVTKSATDCAEYCANVWVERVEAQHREPNELFKLDLPNPMDFLDNKNSAQSGHLSSDILTSFSLLTSAQRQTLMLECSSLLESIPSQFYIRILVGLFVLFELYRTQINTGNDAYLPDIKIWADTWMHLLAASLLGKFKKTSQKKTLIQTQRTDLTVHHILCGLMVSTNCFILLRSYSCNRSKLLKGLDQLIFCSSGFTSTWLNIIKVYFEF